MNSQMANEDLQCPSILFRLSGGLYCADSRHVSTIMELPEHTSLPDTPPYITGIFPFRGGSITMFDLRSALKQRSVNEEFQEFVEMLDQRKQDHINWVNTLEHSIDSGEPFQLATNPHQCKLGKWYDSFHTDSMELSSHLNKMVTPHQKLHETALRVAEKQKLCLSEEESKAYYDALLEEVRSKYQQPILHVLEDAKETFRAKEFHQMVLVLSGKAGLGIVVDEVVSVEMVEEEQMGVQHQLVSYSPYIRRVVRGPHSDELILDIDVEAIINAGQQDTAQRENLAVGT